MSKPTEKRVPLDSIRIDGDTQPRKMIDLMAVADYAADMDAGATFPPGEAVFDGKDYWLWDGFHRYQAELRRENGDGSMRLSVRPGTVEDARWLALGANKSHGIRRTNADKRRAVEVALRMRPKESDNKIAGHVGVSPTTVGTTRKTLSNLDSSSDRIGRDGRTINTAKIGRRPVLDEESRPRPEPQASAGRDGKETPGFFSLPTADPSPKKGAYITLEEWQAMPAAERKRVVRDASGDAQFNAQNNDNIEWALWSWNPVTGCLHNCPYCYARDIANRFYEQKFAPSLIPSRLKAPHNTTFPEAKAAQWMGHKNVFTCSMADLFGRWVPAEWVEAVLAEVRAAPQWNFLFLTKFPIRMAEFDFPENAWVGTTVDCQARVANAEKAFRKVKAGVKWLSCEPLIEPLKFDNLAAFDWVVIGGSSASTQTPEWHPPRAWVHDLERAALKAGCKVYEKTNLFKRIRQYPGVESPPEPRQAPEGLRYLPTDKS